MPDSLKINRTLGAAMRALRRRRALSDAEVAQRMGYGHNGKHYVNRWERGDRGITAASLLRYLAAIDASLVDLDRVLAPRPVRSQRLVEIARELRILAKITQG